VNLVISIEVLEDGRHVNRVKEVVQPQEEVPF